MATDQNAQDTAQGQHPDSETSNSTKHTNPESQHQAEKKQQQHTEQSNDEGNNLRSYRRRGLRRGRAHDVRYEKAVKLVQSGRVEFLGNGVYNVIGDHGTYTVALDHTGKISCNCLGFIQKGVCSHVTAVSLITKNRRHR